MSNIHVDNEHAASYPPPPRPGPGPSAAGAELEEPCLDVPELVRLAYFHGQLLSAADLRAEQSYFREKLKLYNRCLHGHGVLCGLEIEPIDNPCQGEAVGPFVRIRPGIAIDCAGNEIVVRRPVTVSVWSLLGEHDRARLRDGKGTVSLAICHCEQPICRAQPVLPESCGATAAPAWSRIRETFRLEAKLEPIAPPAHAADDHVSRLGEEHHETDHERPHAGDEPCDGCCDGCDEDCDCCALLARLHHVERDKPLAAGDVDNGVRRMLARYVPTRVSGVSWQHGATYSVDEAKRILGTEDPHHGIEIHLTREVDVATLPGALDLWVIEGGRGRNGGVWSMEGAFLQLPKSGYVRKLKYRATSGESLQRGDRMLITLRGAFVLDRCCRPIAGVNVGGKVPLLPDYAEFAKPSDLERHCPRPPSSPGPWTSGSELGGTTFESWFVIG